MPSNNPSKHYGDTILAMMGRRQDGAGGGVNLQKIGLDDWSIILAEKWQSWADGMGGHQKDHIDYPYCVHWTESPFETNYPDPQKTNFTLRSVMNNAFETLYKTSWSKLWHIPPPGYLSSKFNPAVTYSFP